MRGVISQTSQRGLQKMQAWPRKRGAPKSPTTIEQNTLFKKLAVINKLAMDEDKVGARNIAYGSGYTWRDVISRAAVGRLIVWGPDLSDDIQVLLDTICTNPGAMLLRTASGWVCLLPGADNDVLTIDATTHAPAYKPPSGGGGGGLWGSPIGTAPTQAGTGLLTWANQRGSTVADSAIGVTVAGALASTNDNWSIIHKPSPTTPYTITALVACTYTGSNIGGCLLGWYDGTAKLQGARLINNGGTWQLFVSSFTSLTAFQANQIGPVIYNVQQLCWLQLNDNGTNITISVSADGHNFQSIYTVAKSAGPLGATGYSHIAFGCEANSKTCFGSLMSWLQV